MLKKVLVWLIAAFAVFYLITAPQAAADAVKSAGSGLQTAGQSVIDFFDALAS